MAHRDLSDEAIHISAGCVASGPCVGREVYGQLFWADAMPEDQEAAHALHDAVKVVKATHRLLKDFRLSR